jgi:hypothetical protein
LSENKEIDLGLKRKGTILVWYLSENKGGKSRECLKALHLHKKLKGGVILFDKSITKKMKMMKEID